MLCEVFKMSSLVFVLASACVGIGASLLADKFFVWVTADQRKRDEIVKRCGGGL